VSFAEDYARRVLRVLDDKIAVAVERAAAGVPVADYPNLVGYSRGLRTARADLVEPFGRSAEGLPPPP
jgi:hypothetical protein